MKGFAIILVAAGHIMHGYLDAGLFPEYTKGMMVIANSIYSFHMPLFLILSGYAFGVSYTGNHISEQGRKEKIKYQILNIVMLYFMWSLFEWILKMAFQDVVNTKFGVSTIAWIPLIAIGPYWYLYILCFCYLVSFLLLSKSVGWQYILAVSGTACFLTPLICTGIISRFTISEMIPYYFFFFGGYVMSEKKKILELLGKPVFILGCLAIGGLLGYLYCFDMNQKTSWRDLPVTGVLMAGLLSAAFIGAGYGKRSRPLEFIGRYSLEIFLMHIFITSANRKVLSLVGIKSPGLHFTCNLLLAVGIPVLTGIVLKKWKIHHLLFKPVSLLRRQRTG